jgi:ribonucleoside-diphosphate reductase alpha chain
MLKLSNNALKVLESRYLRRNAKGEIIEKPQELFKRVATSVANAEKLFDNKINCCCWLDKFYNILCSLDFLPNSPTLMNAGTSVGQLSACFTIPVEDSIEGIFDAIKKMALIQRTGGGTGFSFTRLRPKNSVVKTTGGKASGPLSFMKIFNTATENIKQGGKRRGANIGVLRVDHPDIIEFITVKKKNGGFKDFNLSVGITDIFINALDNNSTYNLIDPVNNQITETINAKKIFNLIAESAWACGDPGLLFLDRINANHPLESLGKIETTNPCGELPLLPYESCNLGSINLSNMIKGNKQIDWNKIKYTTHIAIRFLDNVIEINKYPFDEIESITKNNRKIGLGVMGFAEMLLKMEISYNSIKAVKTAGEIMSFIREESLEASKNLAKERGVFPNWKRSVHAKYKRKIRNATLNSIAPTGTISIIANTTSGIEPLFALAYKRKNVLDGQDLYEVNTQFLKYIERKEPNYEIFISKLLKSGSISGIEGISKKTKSILSTALEIPYEQHIKIQAEFQKYVDNSVSKTINFPHNSTVDDVKKSYMMAYKLGCKGITIFRYRSKKNKLFEFGVN